MTLDPGMNPVGKYNVTLQQWNDATQTKTIYYTESIIVTVIKGDCIIPTETVN